MFGLFVDSFEDPRFADVPMVKSKMVERERERGTLIQLISTPV